MQFLRTKRLSVLFLFLAVFSQQQVHAGWTDWFNPKSDTFQQQVLPKLKDPKTYVAAAIIAAGAYFIIPEIYWGCKSALPFYRARDYIRSTFAQYISNQGHLDSLANHAREQVSLNIAIPSDEIKKRLTTKIAMYNICNSYRLYYEFSKAADRQYQYQPFRVPQSNENGVKIHDRSSLVRGQVGATCGMHSVFNVSELFKYFTQQNYEHNIIDKLRQGPNIGEIRQTLNSADLPSDSLVGDWTEQAAVHHLMTQQFGMDEDSFTIIPYTLAFESHLDEHFIAKVDELCAADGNCHAFVLGNMRHFGSSAPGSGMKGTSGHWIAVLARKVDDDIALYVMDSIASANTQDAVVNKLAQLIRDVCNMSKDEKQLLAAIGQNLILANTRFNLGITNDCSGLPLSNTKDLCRSSKLRSYIFKT